MKRFLSLVGILLAPLCMHEVTASTVVELTDEQRIQILTEAQKLYDDAVELRSADSAAARDFFRESAQRFEMVATSGVENGRLYYNLANAHLQAGDVGNAILNYRRAERLMPHDTRLQSNLAYARSQVKSQIERTANQQLVDTLIGINQWVSLRWRFIGFALVNFGLWGLLAWIALAGLRHPLANSILLTLAVVWILLGASIGFQIWIDSDRRDGVFMVDDVTVRKGNGTGFEPLYEQNLSAGVEFRLLEERGDWLNIQLANGDEGWIRQGEAALISNR